MNRNFLRPIGEILVLQRTDRWFSSMERCAAGTEIAIRAFDHYQQLREYLSSNLNLIIAVEPGEQADLDALRHLSDYSRRHGHPVILLANPDWLQYRQSLLQSGIMEVFCWTLEIPQLISRARQFFQNRPQAHVSIEFQVQRNLPWAAFSHEIVNTACEPEQSGKH